MMNRLACVGLLLAAAAAPGLGQDGVPKAPSVTMEPPPVADVARGKANPVELTFRVGEKFHINSNKPSGEYMIPTTLKLDAPTDLVVGKITYPLGEDLTLPFAPDEKLNVYTGTFKLAVQVRPLSNVLPGKYEFRGTLKYQACDNAQCFPPKNLPVKFQVNVVKAAKAHKKNPGQSPHVHG